MRGRRLILWLIGGGAAVVAAAAGLGALSDKMRATLMLTTADPGVIGTVQSASLEPVEVVVGTQFEAAATHDALVNRILQKPAVERDHWIRFRLPATYISMIGKAREDRYPWRIGFS